MVVQGYELRVLFSTTLGPDISFSDKQLASFTQHAR
jgi:hypothetical protein